MRPKSDTVIGVCLERTGGTVFTGERSRRGADSSLLLSTKSMDEVDWPKDSPEEAARRVRHLARWAAEIGGPQLYAIGVSGPGPFKSLRRRDVETGTFGAIHPDRSHLPLRGLKLYSIFKEEIDKLGLARKADVVVHTDAIACAIGESILRRTEKRTMLAFFIVGEGIGLGVVRGRSPVRSALHPEVGLLEVKIHEDEGDHLSIRDFSWETKSYSVAQMASNEALRERCNCGEADLKEALDRLSVADRERILDRRAYYLAQMCLACTVTLAPHQIVLGQDVELEADLATRVWKHVKSLLTRRDTDKQPLFDYAELGQSDFISNARIRQAAASSRPLGTTGALGMLYASAAAEKTETKFRPEMD